MVIEDESNGVDYEIERERRNNLEITLKIQLGYF